MPHSWTTSQLHQFRVPCFRLAHWLIVLFLCAVPFETLAQQVGDRALLIQRATGIPGHPAPGNAGVSHRFPSGALVNITALDTPTGWFNVTDVDGNHAWIIKTYIDRVVTATAPAVGLCYRVGTWNLEHFHEGAARGFPESSNGGPKYQGREQNELSAIAAAIREELGIKILILNEIMGEERETEDEVQSRSQELDELVTQLGSAFEYVIASSGKSQRVAILYDTRFVRLNASTEIPVPETRVQNSDIFARDPLLGHFTFLHNGHAQNDLLVVGLHLASGQEKARNHDAAMNLLLRKLNELRGVNPAVPANERDILLGGDLNASKYDPPAEQFFVDLNQGEWAVLAGDTYPATRLANVPLAPKSRIDYLIVTRTTPTVHGLLGEEVAIATASVHQELARQDWDEFRRVYSDHFPVTTCVTVMADND